MTDSSSPNMLQKARKIGLLGDTHGDMGHLLAAARTFKARGIDIVIQAGDWGFIWPNENWNRNLDKISRRLDSLGMLLLVVDGNHDWLHKINEFPINPDGLRRLRHNVAHLPRGYRTTLLPYDSGWPANTVSPGRVLAVLGGANSVDKQHRTEGADWWAEESITEVDLAVLGSEHADVLIGHDAPLDVPDLDRTLASNSSGWPPEAVAYADQGRRMFHRGFMAVRPELYVGGHYHHHVDQTLTYSDTAGSFRCRVVVLDQARPKAISLAVLDTWTLQLELLTLGDTRVERLTMRDQGRWVVRTADADLAFDLDVRTVERRSLPGSRPSPRMDRPMPLLDIRILYVGAVAIYTLDPLDEYRPHQDVFSTAVVDKIERETEM